MTITIPLLVVKVVAFLGVVVATLLAVFGALCLWILTRSKPGLWW